MKYPITVRLWLTEERSDEAEAVAKRRKLLKPQLDEQSGKYYVDIRGHDAFAVAGMVPQELIQLITIRQTIDPEEALAEQSRDQGVYVHGDVEIISEVGHVPYSEQHCGFDSRELFITGDKIAELKRAYNLFREGKLTKHSWKQIEVEEKMSVSVLCDCCGKRVMATREAVKTKSLPSGGVHHYVVCPACGVMNTVSFSGEGTTILQE